MPLYEADSSGRKQKPIVRDGTRFFSHATCPNKETHQKRPSYVIINKKGTYAFNYNSGSESTMASYITGSSLNGDDDRGNASPRLDIQPTSWRKTDATGAVGDVTFVYVRVG